MPHTPGVADHAAIRHPVEPKVKASTGAAAGTAGLLTPAVVKLVDDLFYGGGDLNVPLPYVGAIGLVVTGACTFLAGYYARHVERGAR